MTSRRPSPVVPAIAAALLLAVPAAAGEPGRHRLAIAFTADVSGYLEPCG